MSKITQELLERNGWKARRFHDSFGDHIDYLFIRKDNWYAQFKLGRNSFNLWVDYDDHNEGLHSDVSVRVCDTPEKLTMAFALADIEYKLKTE